MVAGGTCLSSSIWEVKARRTTCSRSPLIIQRERPTWVTRETKILRKSFSKLPRLALNCALSSASQAAGTTGSHFSAQVSQSENAEKPKTSQSIAQGLCRGVVLKLWCNRESVFTDSEGPCSQLVFDLSIKMPVANGWAERGGTSRFLQARREGRKDRIKILGGERWNRLRAAGEIFQNVGGKGKQPTEGHLESVLSSKTNGLRRK